MNAPAINSDFEINDRCGVVSTHTTRQGAEYRIIEQRGCFYVQEESWTRSLTASRRGRNPGGKMAARNQAVVDSGERDWNCTRPAFAIAPYRYATHAEAIAAMHNHYYYCKND